MSVLNRGEAKQHLGISASTYDGKVDTFIRRAESAVVNRVGPLAATSLTESHDGGTHLIRTRFRPIRSITTLTESWRGFNRTLTEQPLDGSNGSNAYGYTYDREYIGGALVGTGTIVRRSSGTAAAFAPGRKNVTVVYNTGWSTDGTSATLPDDLVLAVLELCRAFWEDSQRGGTVAPGRDPADEVADPAYDIFPTDVVRLLEPFEDVGLA